MKRSAFIFISLFALSVPFAFAEDPVMDQPDVQDAQMQGMSPTEMQQFQQTPPQERPRMQEGSGKKMMGHGMMKGQGERPTLIATTDGGVVILAGGKLTKYDAGLNLIKEVEFGPGPKPAEKKVEEPAPVAAPEPDPAQAFAVPVESVPAA